MKLILLLSIIPRYLIFSSLTIISTFNVCLVLFLACNNMYGMHKMALSAPERSAMSVSQHGIVKAILFCLCLKRFFI
jgi:hypothetical protein